MNEGINHLFAGDGEMAGLVRSHDWSQTSLGAIKTWSSSLRTAVSICLNSRFPMVIWWGKELVLIYNDAWRPILGTKHPNALGKSGWEVWPEMWSTIGEQLNGVLKTGQATWSDDLLLPAMRYGYLEEAYFTYSYSPIFLENGEVGGAFTAVTETTKRVIGERQLRTLRELAAKTVEAKSVEKACKIACASLANNPYDIPVALLYLVENDGRQARLVGTVGIEAGTAASPLQVNLTQTSDQWQLAQVKSTGEAAFIDDLKTRFGELSGGVWEESPHSAMVLPIAQSGQKHQLSGLLILGVSPRRKFDDDYRGFFDLVANNVSTAIANAYAYEEERQRAEALAELDRAKTLFFSNVSHEFRTPLTLMLSPVEEILTHSANELPPDIHDQLNLVQRNGLRLLKLVNTLLDFSRIEAGRIQATYEPTDLATLTTELASVFRSAIEKAGMQLIVDCPPLPQPIYVDREMWEKIVLNLISNAFKFTFTGTITVSLRWIETEDTEQNRTAPLPLYPSASFVQLSIQDTGIGIPAAEIPHLFERFHQVKGAQGRNFEGSGIGLSLVQELVHLHRGTVTVTSVEGEGSCFTVSIPTGSRHLPQERISSKKATSHTLNASSYVEEAWRCLPDEESRGAEEQGSKGAGEQGSRGAGEQGRQRVAGVPPVVATAVSRGEVTIPTPLPSEAPQPLSPSAHILLADDNADMRNYVRRLLHQQYEVETVADGVTALERIRQHPPDLLLTDVMMPGIDGFELLRSLRADPQTQGIPIILLSARSGEESRLEGLAAGADDYLIKPFSARELLARVEANLKMARLRRDAAQRERELQTVSEAAQRQAETATTNLETLLATIQDQFFVLDREWRYVYASDRVVEIVGIPRENLLGKKIWDVFPDTVDTDFYTQAHRAMAEQLVTQFEYFYPAWQRWFENRMYPAAEGLSILVTDITERKLAEAALQKSEAIARAKAEELETLMQISPVALWIAHDPNCHYITANQTAYELIRTKPGEWATATPPDGSYPFHFKQLRNGQEIAPYDLPMQRAARTGQEVTDELEFVFEDGTVKFIYGSAVPLKNEQGEIRGVVAAFVDITERKHTEEALKESELKFRTLADTMPQLFWTTRSDGYHEYFNRRWYEFTGMTLEQTQGWGWNDVLHPDDVDRCLAVWHESLRTGKEYNIEYRFRRASDGQYRWFLGQAFPLRDQNGQIIRWFGSCTDIHDQKCALEERDQALERERAAREEAEVANRIKDEFLAVLSHELRSPLNPILGWTKLLLTRKFDEQATKNALRTIERNAKLQTQLIEDLLDVSRILRGKMVLNVCPVDLATVIIAAMETVRLAAEAKGIQIQTVIASNVGLVTGDSARLQQVVWNLLTNAVKFTPEGGQVTIQLQQVGTKAEIQVQDTGKGINPEFLPYVFEYFRQEDGTTTRKFGGLGLGLAIVRHLVELHGGTVKATSLGEDKGATFTVTLPLMTAVPQKEEVILPAVTICDLSHLKILVVDDDVDIRELLLTILEQNGATVKIVASALEVLHTIDEFQPHVLISDIGMPDVDGYMLIRQIRAQKPEMFPKLRTVALTAYAGEIDQRQALAAGFQRHITKPVDPDELVAAIASLVESTE